jgi:UDP-glucose 4-epimerase
MINNPYKNQGGYFLIIGQNSYIGNKTKEWLESSDSSIHVDKLEVRTDAWKTFDYSKYDAIIHVAGIVHRPECKDWTLYKTVNADIPVGIATLAKSQGVKTFVFISTMSVYGAGKKLCGNKVGKDTVPNPEGMYGESKLLGEQGLIQLQDDSFDVVIIRPPMVYGVNCRASYIGRFASITRRLPVMPKAYSSAKTGFVYIDNLTELIRLTIVKHLHGVFCPQDDETVSACGLVELLAECMGKKMYTSRFLGLFIPLISFIPLVRKAYGGVEYDESLSNIDHVDYRVVSFRDAVHRTVH